MAMGGLTFFIDGAWARWRADVARIDEKTKKEHPVSKNEHPVLTFPPIRFQESLQARKFWGLNPSAHSQKEKIRKRPLWPYMVHI